MRYVVIVSHNGSIQDVIGPFQNFDNANLYAERMRLNNYECRICQLVKTYMMNM